MIFLFWPGNRPNRILIGCSDHFSLTYKLIPLCLIQPSLTKTFDPTTFEVLFFHLDISNFDPCVVHGKGSVHQQGIVLVLPKLLNCFNRPLCLEFYVEEPDLVPVPSDALNGDEFAGRPGLVPVCTASTSVSWQLASPSSLLQLYVHFIMFLRGHTSNRISKIFHAFTGYKSLKNYRSSVQKVSSHII